ncbi:MAG: J domain-containing protein [Rhodospirillales bacterium]|nr:J domain-containing protein [Rhodospirillales bacterium]
MTILRTGNKGVTHKVSYYDILGISPKASDEDIKRAYLGMAKKFHPDRNPQNRRLAELRFQVINEAYAGLKTREKRAHYNRTRRLRAENDNKTNVGVFAQIGEFFRPRNKELKH